MNDSASILNVYENEISNTALLIKAAQQRKDTQEEKRLRERQDLLEQLGMNLDNWKSGRYGNKDIESQVRELRVKVNTRNLKKKDAFSYIQGILSNTRIDDAAVLNEKPKISNVNPRLLTATKKQLKSRLWRLRNLYYIINEDGKEVLFRPNKAQKKFLKTMSWRNLILKARQLGFTTFICIFALDLALFNSNFRAGVIAHTVPDAQTIFRDKVLFAYDRLPSVIKNRVKALKRDAGELLLSNNSSIRVGTSFRSATCNLLHISEFGKICARFPHKAREIITGALPALHNGFLFIESTAEGREGKFFEMSRSSEQDALSGKQLTKKDLKFHFFPWHDNPEYAFSDEETGIYGELPERLTKYFNETEGKLNLKFSPGQRAWYASTEKLLGEDMLREHPSSPEEAFQQSIEGAWYARQFKKAYAENRVRTGIRVDPSKPVHTAWDLGRDGTPIWFFQLDDKTGRVRLVDFYQSDHDGLEHYVEVLKDRGYKYGQFLAPHDVKHHGWETGITRVEYAFRHFGIKFKQVPNISFLDGIERVRTMFDRLEIDDIACEKGLGYVQNYRKAWDQTNGHWKNTHLHDDASHAADALRYLCLGIGSVIEDRWQIAQEAAKDEHQEEKIETHEESKTIADMGAVG